MVHRMGVVWYLKILFSHRITLANAWQKQTVLEWCFSVLHKEWMTWQTTTIGQFTRKQLWYQCKYCRQRLAAKIERLYWTNQRWISFSPNAMATLGLLRVLIASYLWVHHHQDPSELLSQSLYLSRKTLQLCPVCKWSVGFTSKINHKNTLSFFVQSRSVSSLVLSSQD